MDLWGGGLHIYIYICMHAHIDLRILRSRPMFAQNLTTPFTEVHGTKVWSTWTHTVRLFGCSMFRIFPCFLAHLQASTLYGQTTQTSNRKPQKYRALMIISEIQINSYISYRALANATTKLNQIQNPCAITRRKLQLANIHTKTPEEALGLA